MFENLKMQFFYRPQQPGENLANFIASIKEARRVLRLPHSEGETIQVLLEGLTPEERSRLALTQIPRNFVELDKWCLQSQSIQFLDYQRQGSGSCRFRSSDQPRVLQVEIGGPPEGEASAD